MDASFAIKSFIYDATVSNGTLNNSGSTHTLTLFGDSSGFLIQLGSDFGSGTSGSAMYALGDTTAFNVFLSNNGKIDVQQSTGTRILQISSPITSSTTSGFVKTGAGFLRLAATSGYTGGTTISAGTILITNSASLGSSSSPIIFSNTGTELRFESAFTLANPVTTNAGAMIGTSSSQNITMSGNISGTGSITYTGNGTLTLSGTNSFSGGLTASAGFLRVASDNALGTDGITLDGSTLQLDNSGSAFGGATINHSLVIGASGADLSFLGTYSTPRVTISGSALTFNGNFVKMDNVSVIFTQTTQTFNSSNITINQAGATFGNMDGTGSLTIGSGFSAATTVNRIRETTLTVSASSLLQLVGGGSTSVLQNITVNGSGGTEGAIDMFDNYLIEQAASSGSASTYLTTATGQAGRGRNSGTWDGQGIRSSTAHANNISDGFEYHAVGVRSTNPIFNSSVSRVKMHP